LYERMNEFHKVLEKNYLSGKFPAKRFYPRLDELAKLRESALLEL